MTRLKMIALVPALLATDLSGQTGAPVADGIEAADSRYLADALTGQTLDLTMRGTTVTVVATASAAENGCAALVTAHAPGSDRRWSRLFRWSDVAWSGSMPDGRMQVTFYDHEALLPVDTVTFRPIDAAAFAAAMDRTALACRAAHGEADRITMVQSVAEPSCTFPRVPGLQLIPATHGSERPDPPRAMLTILARENPEGELQLLFERTAADQNSAAQAWAEPVMAFTFADPRLQEMRISAAAFALDGTPVSARHSLATYGDTRVRITLDPEQPAAASAGAGFDRKLATSGELALTLLDSAKRPQAKLHFSATASMASARRALEAADWSCAGALPAPRPAAHWEPAG